jgi:outer membrane protein OmpA-like peptidoglycan-associated protein
MKRNIGIGAMALTSTLGVASGAWAQVYQQQYTEMRRDETEVTSSIRTAPRRAFELGVDAGWTQPFGDINRGRSIGDLVGPGFGVGLGLGYRISPHFAVTLGGAYHESNEGRILPDSTEVRGLALSLTGTYHFRPYSFIDPYVSLGGGYRMLWQVPDAPQTQILTHGVQLAKLQVGVDYRVAKNVAVGPFVAADLNYFLWDNPEGPRGDLDIQANRVNTFISAGIAGRFDFGGSPRPQTATARTTTVFESRVEAPAAAAPRPARPSTGVRVSGAILSACGISSEPKAFFEFDSANVQQRDTPILDRVAECFSTGPMRGRSLRVVGRADPRGSESYNEKLGLWRADAIASHLRGRGVPTTRVTVESSGEERATGVDEEGWAYDRRVDIMLH